MASIGEVLTRHHEVIRELFTKARKKPARFGELYNHLTVHHKNEEKFLYDLLEKKKKTHHDALEAVEEHHVIEMLLQELSHFPQDHERWQIKLEVLEEYTLHHLEEEEEDIFPKIAKALTKKERQELAEQFQKTKDKQLAVL